MKKRDGTTPTIQVLERTFSLLDVLAAHQDPVSLKEISERTGLHPSTAHRILNDLAAGRLVDRPEAPKDKPGKGKKAAEPKGKAAKKARKAAAATAAG